MKIINTFAKKHNIPHKLHLACGADYKPGWINIDYFDSDKTDYSRGNKQLKLDLKIDLLNLDKHVENNTIEHILMIHALEHFYRWDAIKLLNIFYKILKPNGILELEHPDLDQCIHFYVNNLGQTNTPVGKLNIGFTQFYGNQWDGLEYETHRYVWTKPELNMVLQDIGYTIIELSNNAKYHVKHRDMRVVVKK